MCLDKPGQNSFVNWNDPQARVLHPVVNLSSKARCSLIKNDSVGASLVKCYVPAAPEGIKVSGLSSNNKRSLLGSKNSQAFQGRRSCFKKSPTSNENKRIDQDFRAPAGN